MQAASAVSLLGSVFLKWLTLNLHPDLRVEDCAITDPVSLPGWQSIKYVACTSIELKYDRNVRGIAEENIFIVMATQLSITRPEFIYRHLCRSVKPCSQTMSYCRCWRTVRNKHLIEGVSGPRHRWVLGRNDLHNIYLPDTCHQILVFHKVILASFISVINMQPAHKTSTVLRWLSWINNLVNT